jgi:carbon-monoxide dehydrogenase catalytic subunit
MISTSDKAQFPHMEHHEFHPDNAAEKKAVEWSEALRTSPTAGGPTSRWPPRRRWAAFRWRPSWAPWAGHPDPLIDAIKAGKIRGAVGIVGCNNPKIKHDYGHVTLTRRLIENDILVVDTGCVAVATAKAGFKCRRPLEWPGRASRKSAPPWVSRRCCTWAAAWTTCASWCWWPPWPMHWVDISDLPVAGPRRSGTRKRR